MKHITTILNCIFVYLSRPFKFIKKFMRDFALIFYDDLEFQALSLPRVILGMGAGMMFATWIYVLFGHDFKYFPELTTFCSTTMAPYSVKKFAPVLMAKFGTQNDNGDDDNVAEDKGNDTNG